MHRYIKFLNYEISSYGVCLAIAVLLCGFLMVKRGQKNKISLEDMIVVMAVSLGAALVGGNILYIMVSYTPNQIFEIIKNGNFSSLITGGLVFYGGLIGGALGAIITAKIMKINFDNLGASVIPFVPLGHSIGRIGCLLAGCCYGFEYDGIFAVVNLYAKSGGTYFPVQLLETVFNLMIMTILLLYTRKQRKLHSVLSLYLLLYSLMRLIAEFFRGDLERGLYFGISTSQWISILIIIFCIIGKVLIRDKRVYK